MAHRWNLRATQHGAVRAAANPLGKERSSKCGHSRLAVGQDYWGGRRTEGIRRRQEGARQEASLARGHRGLGPEGQGAQREDPRPGWVEAATELSAHSGVGAEAPLA